MPVEFTLSLGDHSILIEIPESCLWSDTLDSALDPHFRKAIYTLLKADGTHPRFHIKPPPIPADIIDRIAARHAARRNHDYAASDDIRRELAAVGVELIDHADGNTTWRMRPFLDSSTPTML